MHAVRDKPSLRTTTTTLTSDLYSLLTDEMVHQFDDLVYSQYQHQQQQQPPHHGHHCSQQMLYCSGGRDATSRRTSVAAVGDYAMMYGGSGNADGYVDMATTTTSACYHRVQSSNCVTDAAVRAADQRRPPSSLRQDVVYHAEFHPRRQQASSECSCVALQGPEDSGGPATACWALYPSTSGMHAAAADSAGDGWFASVGRG